MAVIIVSKQNRQHKIAARAAEARNKRKHKAYHMQVADGMRAEATHIREYLDNHEELSFEDREQGEARILLLESEAIAQENATCLDAHG
ncbi:hypothetical protein SEA_FEDE_18 [Microbacterium phage Fede]|nr:hypothetical protein SEA_FEDE_18 [Microbacterium phage Fede]